jgi:hypothetical protein
MNAQFGVINALDAITTTEVNTNAIFGSRVRFLTSQF